MLKKLLKILLVLFLLLIMSFNVYAEEEYMLKKYDKVPNDYVAKISSEHQIFDYMYIIARSSDKQFVYCVEPGIHIDDNAKYIGVDDIKNSKLTKEQYERIKLISYYGYKYIDITKGINHTDNNWYAATQGLIWEVENNNHEIYFTNYLQGPKVDKFANEYIEINNLIENHKTLPSFSNLTKEINLGETITLTDNNNVLEDFKISISNNNINAQIKGNTLIINPLNNGTSTITLTKEFNFYNATPLIYSANNSQTLFAVGNLDPITTNITLNVQGSKVIINKIDNELETFTPQGDATLIGAVYGLYDLNDNLLTTLTINENGLAESTNILKINTDYYLKEITPSIGYELDTNKYYYKTNNQINNIVLKEQVIKRKVDIYKVLGSNKTKILTPEPNVKFNIYQKSTNNFYQSITTNESGHANITLPYGTWIFIQQNSKENYAKVDNFEITVDALDEEPITKILSDTVIFSKVKVIKLDAETEKLLPLSNIKFKIKNTDTNEYICQKITYPEEKNICEYLTTNGTFITPYSLPIGNYALEEVNEYIEGYEINNEPLKFTISKDSSFLKEDGEQLLELKFKNMPKPSSFELTKQDFSTGEVVSNALISIYNFNDELISSSYTDQHGKIFIDNLKIGKYYFKEEKAPEGYLLNNDKHYFEITENGQIIKDTLVNERISVPNTLKNNIYYFEIFSLGLISLGIKIINRKYE